MCNCTILPSKCNMVHSIKQLQFTKNIMNFQEFTLKPNKNIIRHISHNEPANPKQLNHLESHHRFTENKAKLNLIKINKNKLPNDFFQNKVTRRVSQQKIYYAQQYTEPVLYTKRIQSQRLIYSPEKTSFFGFLQEKSSQRSQKINALPPKMLNRKFQTRQEPKRDTFGLQISRKITGTSKTSKRDLLQLFPPTFDDRMNDIINESSKSHIHRASPKRQLIPIQREPHLLANPEKIEQADEIKFPSARKHKDMAIKLTNMSFFENQISEGMNITFYHAKSNCLPPINRHIA